MTLLALGPLTNLALAIRLAPDIVGKVQEVVMMGGSFGQQNTVAEFNARSCIIKHLGMRFKLNQRLFNEYRFDLE